VLLLCKVSVPAAGPGPVIAIVAAARVWPATLGMLTLAGTLEITRFTIAWRSAPASLLYLFDMSTDFTDPIPKETRMSSPH
jgi:hypothetical protein